MHYVYLLKSKMNNKIYIGSTNNLKRRIKEHNSGLSKFTKKFRPWEIYYCEIYKNKHNALAREKNLKYYGKALAMLRKRIGL